MLFEVIKRVIKRNPSADIRERVATLYVTGDLTTEQYTELVSLFNAAEEEGA